MNRPAANSFQVCLALSYGLVLGLAVYFAGRMSFNEAGWLTSVAYFVAYVLLNAVLGGIVAGAVLSVVIFPAHYFIIRRYNAAVAWVFFILGLMLGIFGFKILLAALR